MKNEMSIVNTIQTYTNQDRSMEAQMYFHSPFKI